MQNASFNLETLQYLKTLTLLCVEDNKTTQLLYASIFEDLVKNISYAYDGKEGYQKFLDEDIDIIISDYDMPICNGVEMIEKIRDKDKNIPIILVSAIQEIDVIVKSLQVGVNSFVRKPIQISEVLKVLEDSTKLLIADEVLQKQKQIEKYRSYQENLGFSKELNILRNDFYYHTIDNDPIALIDFSYQPLDILSGDAYCARRIDEHVTFYLMVDGMGKGLSASLTAMIMTSFINHIIDKMLETDNFDLSVIVSESIGYIKRVLIEEEVLAIDYIVIDNECSTLYYSKFAMPVILMEDDNNDIVRIKSNNPALSKWQNTFKIDSCNISKIRKFLIYTDGIVENETIFDAKPYSEFIEEDFLNSFTKEDLKNSFKSKIKEQEDDVTLIYIHNLNLQSVEVDFKKFHTTLAEINNANIWYENIFKNKTIDEEATYKAGLVFTELFMNAYEHGNLNISNEVKHNLLENDKYFDMLLEKEKECKKYIQVKVSKIKHHSACYIITQITDEGEGFDTHILSEIFRNSAAFNGRGVFVSRKESSGIYYNIKGNSVLYLNKIERS